MKKPLDGITIHQDLDEAIQAMSNEDAGTFLKQLFNHKMKREVSLPQNLELVFRLVRSRIDLNEKRRAELSEKRREAGKRGIESRYKKA